LADQVTADSVTEYKLIRQSHIPQATLITVARQV
jgi:hypothetical protein